ncbi:MAG: GreA/GreB family elongation factor [Myxococcota bacterium]|nr:GreA/GreB family elongation factor [Myxococcota bacterium]
MSRPMTLQGYEAIQAEIDRLWTEERPVVVKEVSDAADLGDRSENAAYIYGKKRLRHIDSRIRYLRKKLDGVVPVDLSLMVDHPTVRFGAIVTVENEEGEVKTWRLVDKEESEPKKHRISVQSPVGRALAGKKVGDVVEVRLQERLVELELLELRYGAGEP